MNEDERIDSLTLMRAEARQLHQAIESHMVVDRAIGVVIVLGRLAPDQGWDVLKDVSQHTNTKLREVAGQVVPWANGGQPSEPVRHALDSALARRHQGLPASLSSTAAASASDRASGRTSGRPRAPCPRARTRAARATAPTPRSEPRSRRS